MKTAAGIKLYSQVLDKYLLGHPTEIYGRHNDWTIPKGETLFGEDIWDCAVRELYEETGLDILNFPGLQWDNHVAAASFLVTKRKTTRVFTVIDPSGYLTDFPFYCESLIDGTKEPEIDAFAWFSKQECYDLVTPSQKILFDK